MKSTGSPPGGARPRRLSVAGLRRTAGRLAAFALLLLPSYALLAYVLLPAAWRLPAARILLPPARRVSFTQEGIPADPLNVALVGSRLDVIGAMRAVGWSVADPITLRSGLRDANSILFDRPYANAPMSTHYLENRPQDLAFEKTVGGSPRRRHHARFWRVSSPSNSGELWIGAATYDLNVGVSYRTGEIMHHIDPDVDAERERLFADLARADRLESMRLVPHFRTAGSEQNGGGDLYRTDGALRIGALSSASGSGSGGANAKGRPPEPAAEISLRRAAEAEADRTGRTTRP